tara:strand:+ start:5460 stop:5690 length:231 start_codon:yes stop_codon:yes gene_type:complete
MDIRLIETEKGTNIQPLSIHGMLWLQTHFESIHWEALAQNQVLIRNSESLELSKDAQEGGIIIKLVPVISSTLGKF